jgi:serine/threonine protein kinase
MPPEVMGQEAAFSFAADVYSFGILLFELMTGGKPFHGMAAYQVVEAVVQKNERPMWPEEAYAPIKDLAERCVERDPASRPSFAEIVEELRDLLDPSLSTGRVQDHASECNSISNESDELEAALHQQKAMGKKLQLQCASTAAAKSTIPGTATLTVDESIVDQGPPKDPLGRMLYYLSSMPAFSNVEKFDSEHGGSYWFTVISDGDKKQLVTP